MLIRADGSIVGTVGGRRHGSAHPARRGRVIKNGASELTEYVLEEIGAAAIGAVCGGRATILVDFYAPEQWSIAYFERLLKAAESDERSYIAVAIPRTGPLAPRNSCLFSGGALFGAEGLDADAVSYLSRSIASALPL
jgi:xanthine dehydrogenase accessory factor